MLETEIVILLSASGFDSTICSWVPSCSAWLYVQILPLALSLEGYYEHALSRILLRLLQVSTPYLPFSLPIAKMELLVCFKTEESMFAPSVTSPFWIWTARTLLSFALLPTPRYVKEPYDAPSFILGFRDVSVASPSSAHTRLVWLR